MMMVMKENKRGGATGEKEEKKKKNGFRLNEELRTVPSGPNPLHLKM